MTKVYRYKLSSPSTGTIRTLKDSTNFLEYINKLTDKNETAIIVKPPSIATLQRWDTNGYCKAVDGCKVEPDSCCSHNLPSWLIVYGLI